MNPVINFAKLRERRDELENRSDKARGIQAKISHTHVLLMAEEHVYGYNPTVGADGNDVCKFF